MSPIGKVTTGSDAFILTATDSDKNIPLRESDGREFRFTVTIHWEEYRDPAQRPGSLWLEADVGTAAPALPGVCAGSQIMPNRPATLVRVTKGAIDVHYTGVAKAHVWLSYFAEFAD
jgi:hypothetical protein